MTSATYQEAMRVADQAFATYNPIRIAYHAGNVSDDTYLAARATYHAAQMVFDNAWRAAAYGKDA
jgi:hypothetical protein